MWPRLNVSSVGHCFFLTLETLWTLLFISAVHQHFYISICISQHCLRSTLRLFYPGKNCKNLGLRPNWGPVVKMQLYICEACRMRIQPASLSVLTPPVHTLIKVSISSVSMFASGRVCFFLHFSAMLFTDSFTFPKVVLCKNKTSVGRKLTVSFRCLQRRYKCILHITYPIVSCISNRILHILSYPAYPFVSCLSNWSATFIIVYLGVNSHHHHLVKFVPDFDRFLLWFE